MGAQMITLVHVFSTGILKRILFGVELYTVPGRLFHGYEGIQKENL